MSSDETVKTLRVKSSHPKSQGDFVEINETDYNPEKHTLHEQKMPPPPPPAGNPADSKPITNGLLTFANKAAKDKAVESGLDFSKVKGTGANGAITAKNVTDAIAAATAPKSKFDTPETAALVDDLGLSPEDVLTVKGTGANGLITSDDLQKFVDGKDGE